MTFSKTYFLAGHEVNRMGYGAMQLAGPGVFGPPANRAQCVEVLREALELGVNHIDTSDFYGPHIVNDIIREALAPYPADLTLVTKVGARRDAKGAWLPAQSPGEITAAVEDNLRNLGLDVLEVVNLRAMFDMFQPAPGSLRPQLEALAQLVQRGLVKHVGLSNVTHDQVREGFTIMPIACVQNHYNLVQHADDRLIDELAERQVPYVPFFPLGGFTPIQSDALSALAQKLGHTPHQLALAWLLQRSPNILLIPGTSSLAHLRQNLAAADITLDASTLAILDGIGASSRPSRGS
ncbi:oxidoreductase [Formicincola oecophyllae]|uniref:Oxidoreductase n=1 Tax=Formicincola oecophyllae TaxID=2558361 RepID=A0A4Y6UAL6_9PROT|nr:oxidoreductase [Formicincola oecophyllae]QDH13175.1 oxidoreductase [Formicincola oecophyllae]